MTEGRLTASERIQRIEKKRPKNYFAEEMRRQTEERRREDEAKVVEQRQVDVVLMVKRLNEVYGDQDFRSQMQDAVSARDLGLLQSALDLLSNKSLELKAGIRELNNKFLVSEEDVPWEELEKVFGL